MSKNSFHLPHAQPKTLLIGIETPHNQGGVNSLSGYFEEFISLAKTNMISQDHTLMVKLRTVDSAYFFTEGKLAEVKKVCEENNIEVVVLSESITAQQERNLSDYLGCDVCDRTRLILEIFHKAAFSAEGKTQIEIAILQYKKTRLAGKGKGLMQQFGKPGARSGPGETLKERQKRYLDNRIHYLKKELVKIQQHRDTQRKQRTAAQTPQICLVGYTNSGKSTLLNALTKSNVLVEDKLFATLDTTTRALYINGVKKGVLSDTVGFIQNLPTTLIEAFKSTLAELNYADLLLVVIDISDKNWEKQGSVVHAILHDLSLDDKEVLYVFNKADKVSDSDFNHLSPLLDRYIPHVVISAQSPEGLAPLYDFLDSWKKPAV